MREITPDLGLIIDAIIVRWKMIVWITILLPTAALLANEFAHRPYRATSRLIVQETRNVNPFLGDMLVDLQRSNRFPVVNNVLRSRTVAEQMLRELGEVTDTDSPDDIEWMLEDYQMGLTIDHAGGGVIRITMAGETPEQALDRLQLAMDTMREEMLRPQREALTGSVDFLAEQVVRSGQELAVAEDSLREFKEEHADELPEVYEGNLDRYLATLDELEDAEADLGVAEGQLVLSREQLSQYNPGVRDIERDLNDARLRLDRLLEVYTEEHPEVPPARDRVRILQRDLERARQRLFDELPEGSTSIEVTGSGQARVVAGDMVTGELLTYRQTLSQVDALRYRIERLREQRDLLRETVRSFAANEQQLGALTRDVEARQEMYVNLDAALADARLTREVTLQTEASRLWVIEAPTLPPEKNRRSRRKVGIGALVATYVLLTGLIAVLEFLEPSVRTTNEAVDIAGAPVIASLPRLHDTV